MSTPSSLAGVDGAAQELSSRPVETALKVLAHPDPFALEALLLAGISAAQADDPLARVLVVVPTTRLTAHVRRRLAQTTGGGLAVEVLPYRALTLRAAASLDGPPRRLASSLLLRVLLDRALAASPDNPWAHFVKRRPGARTALLSAVTDLREAGVTPDEVRMARRELPGETTGIGEVYAAYVHELAEAAPRGLRDEASLVAEVLDTITRDARRQVAIFHHGAYELIGMHLDLVRALDRAAPLTFLLPCEPGAPAYRYAETFARRHLLDEQASLVRQDEGPASDLRDRESDRSTGLLGSRLAALGDETVKLPPIDPPAVRFRRVQGPAAEAQAALRQAIRDVADGVPAEDIAIVARDLGMYTPTFETEFTAHALPWTSSAGRPLRSDPTIADLVALFDLAARDYPRAATAEWLATPRVDWQALLPDEVPVAVTRADAWSRQAGILGGLREWTEVLPAWAIGTSQQGQVDGVARAVSALHELIQPEQRRRWSAHADRVEAVLSRLFPLRDEEAASVPRRRLRELLADMRALETMASDERKVGLSEMAAWLHEATTQTTVRTHSQDTGGFRLLDLRQARGLTFRRTHFLGLQTGAFPRLPREDAVLRDDLRARLRETTGRPLPTAQEAEAEEDLLLALTLGSAGEALDLSWQHSDDDGRTVSPSLAVREVARITLGTARLAVAEQAAGRSSGHPERSLEEALAKPGLLAPQDHRVLTALHCGSPEAAARALLPDAPELRAGLAMLAATESFVPQVLDYDGRAGTAGVPSTHSATRLQTLGSCPLRYFFQTVLRVHDPDPDVVADQIEPVELGTEIHRLLQETYQRLADENSFDADPEVVCQRAALILDEIWPDLVDRLTRRRAARLPLLWDLLQERWRAATNAFVAADVRRMVDEGWQASGFEVRVQRMLDLGDGFRLHMRGQFDRVLRRGAQRLVGDYKSGGIDSARHGVDITKMLKAEALQVPVYQLLAGEETSVELLPLALADGGMVGSPAGLRFDGFENAEQQAGFQETLQVLAGLLQAGRFPLHPGDDCGWCRHALACRKDHPPTREREAQAVDTANFRDTKRKNKTRKPTLAAVRAACGAVDDRDEGTT